VSNYFDHLSLLGLSWSGCRGPGLVQGTAGQIVGRGSGWGTYDAWVGEEGRRKGRENSMRKGRKHLRDGTREENGGRNMGLPEWRDSANVWSTSFISALMLCSHIVRQYHAIL